MDSLLEDETVVDDGIVEIGSFSTPPSNGGDSISEIEVLDISDTAAPLVVSNWNAVESPIELTVNSVATLEQGIPSSRSKPTDNYEFVGSEYGTGFFVNRYGLVYYDGSRAEYLRKDIVNFGVTEQIYGCKCFWYYPECDEEQRILLGKYLPILITKLKQKDIKYEGLSFTTVRVVSVPGIVSIHYHNGIVTAEGSGIYEVWVEAKPLDWKAARKGTNGSLIQYKKRLDELNRSLTSIKYNLDYYIRDRDERFNKLESYKKSMEIVNSLPEDIRNAIDGGYELRPNPSISYTEETRYVSIYQKQFKETEDIIAALVVPTKPKKKELIEIVNRGLSFCDIYTTNYPRSFIFKFKNELVLKYENDSIEYGRPILTLSFGKSKYGEARVTDLKGYSLDKKAFIHPHLRGDRAYCLGTYPTHLINAYKSAGFYEMGMLLWAYLNSYNPDSPLVPWSHCKEEMKNA